MAMLRMNMGQKHAAKNMTKVAFAERRPTEITRSPSTLQAYGSESGDKTERINSSKVVTPVNSESHHAGEGLLSPGSSSIAAQRVAFAETPNPDVPSPGHTPGAVECTEVMEGPVKEIRNNEGEGGSEGSGDLRSPSEKLRANGSVLTNGSSSQVPMYQQQFNLVMGALIILNTVLIAVETDFGPESGTVGDRIGWIIIDTIFILVFMGEIGVRIHWEGFHPWVRSPWNWVDVFIVAFAIIDMSVLAVVSGDPGQLDFISIFRIIRLVRLVRLVKLVRLLQGLYLILMAFWHAMQTMSFLLAMMMFGLMVYSIFAVNLIGRNPQIRNVKIHDDTAYDRFGTVYRSMYSLFELLTLEGWEQVARPIVEAQPLIFVFIVSFIMIFTFGMLNMVVALVIDKTLHHSRLLGEQNQAAERDAMVEELYRIHDRYHNAETTKMDGKVTEDEFQTILSDPAILYKLHKMGIKSHEARDLYSVLDWDQSGVVDIDEMVEGLSKLQDNVLSAWDSMATHSYARIIKHKVNHTEEAIAKVNKEQERMQAAVTEQQRRLSRIEAAVEANSETLQGILSALRGMQMGCGYSPTVSGETTASGA